MSEQRVQSLQPLARVASRGLVQTRIGQGAVDGTARQPEATGDIRTTMIISAALIEGVALFGMVICVLLVFK